MRGAGLFQGMGSQQQKKVRDACMCSMAELVQFHICFDCALSMQANVLVAGVACVTLSCVAPMMCHCSMLMHGAAPSCRPKLMTGARRMECVANEASAAR